MYWLASQLQWVVVVAVKVVNSCATWELLTKVGCVENEQYTTLLINCELARWSLAYLAVCLFGFFLTFLVILHYRVCCCIITKNWTTVTLQISFIYLHQTNGPYQEKKQQQQKKEKDRSMHTHKHQKRTKKIIKNTVMTQQIQQHYHKPASFL